MRRERLLELDALGNLVLGVLFLGFSESISSVVGVPAPADRFYPTVLGAILFGIGLALLIQRFRGQRRVTGLGLVGASTINLCFGVALSVWLLTSSVEVTAAGAVLLWGLASILLALGGVELLGAPAER